jgi:hypothetical protein
VGVERDEVHQGRVPQVSRVFLTRGMGFGLCCRLLAVCTNEYWVSVPEGWLYHRLAGPSSCHLCMSNVHNNSNACNEHMGVSALAAAVACSLTTAGHGYRTNILQACTLN